MDHLNIFYKPAGVENDTIGNVIMHHGLCSLCNVIMHHGLCSLCNVIMRHGFCSIVSHILNYNINPTQS